MNPNAIECRAVVKNYKGAEVLRGLDLAVPQGSVYGLLGANGAGKSTLLKCMMGMLNIQQGDIRVLGRPSAELDGPTKARIAYVPQVNALYPWMKVRQIADYIGSFYPLWDKKRVYGLIDAWGLPFEAKVRTLSVGQAQKLAIILALGHESDLLIFDEPAASLDPGARREFLRQIFALFAERRPTVIFSTHITTDIERVADHVGILKDGRMAYSGELGSLKDSVKRLYLRPQAENPKPLNYYNILAQEIRNGESVITVRDFDAAFLARLQADYRVEVMDMNLEDIFLSYAQKEEA